MQDQQLEKRLLKTEAVKRKPQEDAQPKAKRMRTSKKASNRICDLIDMEVQVTDSEESDDELETDDGVGFIDDEPQCEETIYCNPYL